jgi:hypothetical protein
LLFEADIWHLTGQSEIARARAREALEFTSLTLHSAAFVGPFSRWLVFASESLDERRKAKSWLSSTMANLESHDALDQVELLCACIHIKLAGQVGGIDIERMLKEKLAELPYSINEQLKRFGLEF